MVARWLGLRVLLTFTVLSIPPPVSGHGRRSLVQGERNHTGVRGKEVKGGKLSRSLELISPETPNPLKRVSSQPTVLVFLGTGNLNPSWKV